METTKKLAEFASSTRFDDLPEEVINEAKLCFFDWLGVALAGTNEPDVNILFDIIKLIGGKEQATILGKNIKTSILNATLINGMSSHVFDFDDTSVEFLGHASVTLFPCLLALSEWMEKSGKELLTAYIIGFEIGCRVAMGTLGSHALTGWHATSTIGHFSSTAGAAKLLGLDAEQLIYAFGIAGTQAAGLKAVFGTSCKPFHPGKAGFNGLLSALLAQKGFTSVENILEGEKCFWDVYSTNWNPKRALKDLGKKWHILKNKYKFHASCYYTHAPIETIIAIKENVKILDINKIDKIEIVISPVSLENASIMNPSTGLEGKFSIPYVIANAILRNDTGIKAFTNEKVNEAEIIELIDKIKIITDTKLAPFKARATVYIGKEEYKEEVNLFNQVLDNIKKKQEIHRKFSSLLSFNFKKDKIEEIIKKIERLEQENNMSNIVNLLTFS